MRNKLQKVKDFLTFPIRAVALIETDRWGFSSLATERFDYVANEVQGYCLDVGCGKYNRFITSFLNGNGRGVDVYPYEGLTDEHLVKDISCFPFDSDRFDSIAFIANLNHVPAPLRDIELKEAYRCLKSGGNVIVTMGNPIAEILVHKLVWFYDKYFGTRFDMDNERGMHLDEEYYLKDSEIRERLIRAGFQNIKKKYFVTQWGLNHLFAGWKP